MTQATELTAAPLIKGTGPDLFEMFLEPTCPFSVRAFNKIDALLDAAGEDKISVKITLISQPWHMFSGVVTRAVLAAATLPDGAQAAFKVMQAVADHREKFEFEDHCRGPNMDTTPREILHRLESYSGVALADAFDVPQLQKVIKRHTKYARQNGIHISPTFMINGIAYPEIGSGEPVEDWAKRIFQEA
ncbi:thioredoxin [Thioclava sp. SK-1]|uniref:DsbA family protein n=1 Tax=Thioclava sp. SK-1 TaxID=1889770 RepID=UPI000826BD1E|nr:thioredoxin domain-containing protein [Thioclava sp. SK-1]OCX61295.1 thioredoxin [Thioclava sp. SK-1]